MFSKNLKYLRQRAGMEQLELAYKLGRKSASTISEWEKGRYTPKIAVLSKIASIFNVDLDDMMNLDLETHSATSEKTMNATFSVTESEQAMLTKYRALDDYGVEMVDFTLEKQYERCAAERTAKVSRFPEPDYLTPIAAHERTDIEVTQEMIDHDNDIMDDDDF